MLLQRTLTAIVLIVVLLAAALSPFNWPLLVFFGFAASACLWEWMRMTLGGGRLGVSAVVALAFLCLTLLVSFQGVGAVENTFPVTARLRGFMALVLLAWVVIGAVSLYNANSAKSPRSLGLSLFGLLSVFAAWLSLVYVYEQAGAIFLVSFLGLVWAADIAAYFGGKTLGRRKLAPSVSPGKTWEGAIAGVMGSVVWIIATQFWQGSFATYLFGQFSWWFVIVLTIALAVLSIMGDLFESLLKRRAGVKDSSGLLPGHGGVFDRLDALLPIAPLAYLLLTRPV
ncbi:MAG: phosphatidate cytidylyltransferase [Pusillimonas sp.]|mgnify:CR=1 FL=1|nr:phosphatidate cytidylyltransferase [Pusillimonas sp.]